ncbi:MAG: hypothetical protein HOP08_19405 [Cyclobacteriaceae bacterium]|nr:hypothetical protein [Cyclobacteriaceae bacterium]
MRFILISALLLFTLSVNAQAPVYTNIDSSATATIILEGYPDWIELEKNSVWISNGGLNAIQRINPKTNQVEAEVKINEPCAAFTIGFGSVWVMSCGDKALKRISLDDNLVKASIPLTIASDEGSIVADRNGIWILSSEEGVLTRIDPATNEVVAHIRVKPHSFAAMAGYGYIWITNTGAADAKTKGSVQVIDPRTNKITMTIPVGIQPRFLAVGEKGIWVFNQTMGTVSRIDPETYKVVATIDCGLAGTGGDISAGDGYVWVRGKTELMVVIDSKTNRPVARFGPPAGSGAVRVGAGFVWISAHDVNKVWKLEVKKMKELKSKGIKK